MLLPFDIIVEISSYLTLEECASTLCCASKFFNSELPKRYPRKSKTSFLDGFDSYLSSASSDVSDNDGDKGCDETDFDEESHNLLLSRRFSRLFELDLSLYTLPEQLTIELQNISPGPINLYNSLDPQQGDSISILNLSNCEFEDNILKDVTLPRNINKLVLSFTEITSLYDVSSLSKLKKLKILECTSCTYLQGPLNSIDALPDSLQILDFSHCSQLLSLSPSFPINLLSLRELKVLSLSNTDFNDNYLFDETNTIHMFPPALEELDISSTQVGLRTDAAKFDIFPASLRKLRLYRCKKLGNDSAILQRLPKKLTHLDLSGTRITLIENILPDLIVNLDVSSTKIERIPLLPNLKYLDVSYCENLQDISSLSLSKIEELELINCKSLENPSIILEFKKLKSLKITGCKKMSSDLEEKFNKLYDSF